MLGTHSAMSIERQETHKCKHPRNGYQHLRTRTLFGISPPRPLQRQCSQKSKSGEYSEDTLMVHNARNLGRMVKNNMHTTPMRHCEQLRRIKFADIVSLAY